MNLNIFIRLEFFKQNQCFWLKFFLEIGFSLQIKQHLIQRCIYQQNSCVKFLSDVYNIVACLDAKFCN